MKGNEAKFEEKTHRHPSAWWEMRYTWRDEAGEPQKPDYKACGRNVHGLDYMRDEFPEQGPNEKVRLNCLLGTKQITLPCIDLTEDEVSFPEVAKNLRPSEFLRTQREKFEAACMRALTKKKQDSRGRKKQGGVRKVDKKVLRRMVSKRLMRQKRRSELKDFLSEMRARKNEGYSVRQLIKSHIPDIGTEMRIPASEVNEAMKQQQVLIYRTRTPELFSYLGGGTISGPPQSWGVHHAGDFLV